MRWEVRTMRSGTSLFNGTIFKKTLLRFWPIWASNLVLWLLVFPLNFLAQMPDISYMTASLMYGTVGVLVAGAMVLAVMTAMAVCSHLYQSRSANFFGALPVRREGVFLSLYLAGLCMMWGPNVIVFLLMIPVEAMGHALMMTPLLMWLVTTCVLELFFFSAAVLCGMFTGHIIALPVFFGVFNALAVSVYSVGQFIMREFYYGYAKVGGALEELVFWLTPAARFLEVGCAPIRREGVYAGAARYMGFELEGLHILPIYTAAAVAFTALALFLYCWRRMETAGDVVAIPALRPVFRYGVAICVGVLFGFGTTAMLNLGELGLMVSIVLWAVVGGFVAQMLLDKTAKVFHKWRGCAALALAFIALFVVIGLDLTGYETRVPQAGQVASVEVTGLNCPPYDRGAYLQRDVFSDPQLVETIVQLHQKAVDQRQEVWHWDEDTNGWGFTITYTLQNGSKLAREYTLHDKVGNRADGSITSLVQQVIDAPQQLRQRYQLDGAQELLDQGGLLTCDVYYNEEKYSDGTASTKVGARESGFYAKDEALTLWQAAMQDFEEGTLGRHDAAVDEVPFVCELRFEVERQTTKPGLTTPQSADVERVWTNIDVTKTARHTLAALASLEK